MREHDALRIATRAILLLVPSTSSDHEESEWISSMLLSQHRILSFLHIVTPIINVCISFEKIGKTLSARSAKNPFRKEYKRNLRREWYPLLNSIDQIVAQKRIVGADVDAPLQVRRAWLGVGTIGMGLDEEQEREDYNRRAIRFCSWRECQWHTVEAPRQPKACTGCGETVR